MLHFRGAISGGLTFLKKKVKMFSFHYHQLG